MHQQQRSTEVEIGCQKFPGPTTYRRNKLLCIDQAAAVDGVEYSRRARLQSSNGQ
jgi:hypothetical protein